MTEPEQAEPDQAGPEQAGDGCDAHQGLGSELRALLLTALDRLEPALHRMRSGPPASAPTCTGCPVCAVLVLLRGEHPELAGRVAEQLGGLLTVLRAALEEGDPAAAPAATGSPEATGGSTRRVQHIPVERVAR